MADEVGPRTGGVGSMLELWELLGIVPVAPFLSFCSFGFGTSSGGGEGEKVRKNQVCRKRGGDMTSKRIFNQSDKRRQQKKRAKLEPNRQIVANLEE